MKLKKRRRRRRTKKMKKMMVIFLNMTCGAMMMMMIQLRIKWMINLMAKQMLQEVVTKTTAMGMLKKLSKERNLDHVHHQEARRNPDVLEVPVQVRALQDQDQEAETESTVVPRIVRKRVERDQSQGQGDGRDIQAHQAAGPGLGLVIGNVEGDLGDLDLRAVEVDQDQGPKLLEAEEIGQG